MALSLPTGFIDLTSVATGPFDIQLNTIGVVVDFLPPTRSGGTDFTIKFTLHDHSWTQGIGLTVRFFQKQDNQLPSIQNQGDVVILRNVKLKNYHGMPTVLSNSTSSWVVVEGASLQDSTEADGSDIIIHQSGAANHRAARPNDAEIKYAKDLLAIEDPSRWQRPAAPTSLQVAGIQRANGGIPGPPADKFRKIEDLQAPQHGNDRVYVDLLAEVRRLYVPDHSPPRVEVSVTDYTEHSMLYKYSPEAEDSEAEFDGDRFRYIEHTHKLWAGPWGKKTLLVLLWQPHCDFAIKNVEPGSFVVLRNVQITLDRNGTKMEGHLRTDRFYESKVNVSVLKAREADGDERFTALLLRKRAYEEHCRKVQLRFMRDPKMPIKQQDLKRKDVSTGNDNESNLNPKAKRNRDKKRRRKGKTNTDKNAAPDGDEDAETKDAVENVDSESKTLSANAHVRCHKIDIPPTTIASILDPSSLLRRTPADNPFYLPFQNCCYKSKVRVVDFFPDNLEDFAAPFRESQYAGLEDHPDSESDVGMSDADADTAPPVATEASGDGGIKWQWRFMMLVEDARSQPAIHRQGEEDNAVPQQLELLVADTDADYLLRDIDPCNLRKNPKTLARLREKLFVLWGDLQERKEDMKNGDHEMEIGGKVKASARPFECFIKEYGIRSIAKEGEWDRMFRMCYTSI